MDDETAAWVRVEAAKADKSVSRWLGELVRERRNAKNDDAYAAAYQAWKNSWQGRVFRKPGDRYPTREEMHER
jgi:hypothetical protein